MKNKPTMNKQNPSEIFLKARLKSGKSQKQVATELGKQSMLSVSLFERGLSSPTLKTLIKLCEIVGLKVLIVDKDSKFCKCDKK